jgi:hypothetical protein
MKEREKDTGRILIPLPLLVLLQFPLTKERKKREKKRFPQFPQMFVL